MAGLRFALLALVGLTVQTHALVLPAGTGALSRVGTIGASQQLCRCSASRPSCSGRPETTCCSGLVDSPSVGRTFSPHSVRSVPTRHLDVVMAVPKKRQSKMKTRQRKANVSATPRPSCPSPCPPQARVATARPGRPALPALAG